jgi:transposase
MKTVALDVHADKCQMVVMSKHGEVFLEMQVATEAEELRRAVSAVPGPKRVVFEEGPMSALIYDALKDVADQIISSDPTRNSLIARAEDSNDLKDAISLGTLAINQSISAVYVPEEPYRSLRSMMRHDHRLMQTIVALSNAMKAVCRRGGVRTGRTSMRHKETRAEISKALPNPYLRWELASLARRYELSRLERVRVRRMISRITRELPQVGILKTIPGVKTIIAPTLVAWIVDPKRFATRSKVSSYAGLGLGQGFTNWQPVGRARASRRGNRQLKRALFLAATTAINGRNRLAQRYEARIASGWDHRKAIRDIARTILIIACRLMDKGGEYDDGRVSVPSN